VSFIILKIGGIIMSLTAFNRRRRLTQEQEAAKKEGEAMERQETTAPEVFEPKSIRRPKKMQKEESTEE